MAFLIVIFMEFPQHLTVALALFCIASLTDYFDGKIARRDKLITNFGVLMDPLADKILVCSAFIAFVENRWIPAWMVVIVVARELAITGLRLLAASKNVVLAAEGYGKHKTISQIVAIIWILVRQSYGEMNAFGQALFGFHIFGKSWVVLLEPWAVGIAVLLTFSSGTLYLWRNRQLYLADL